MWRKGVKSPDHFWEIVCVGWELILALYFVKFCKIIRVKPGKIGCAIYNDLVPRFLRLDRAHKNYLKTIEHHDNLKSALN